MSEPQITYTPRALRKDVFDGLMTAQREQPSGAFCSEPPTAQEMGRKMYRSGQINKILGGLTRVSDSDLARIAAIVAKHVEADESR